MLVITRGYPIFYLKPKQHFSGLSMLIPFYLGLPEGIFQFFHILGNIGNVIIPTDFHSIIQFVVRSAHIFPLAKTDARLGHAYVDFADESQAEVKLSPLAEPGNWLGVDWVGR